MEYLKYADGIIVEIDDRREKGVEQYAGGLPSNEKITKMEETFGGACDDLKKIIDSLSNKISELEKKPDVVELSLGIKLSSDTGLIIAKVSAEGTLGIKLTWKKEKGEGHD